MRKTMTLLLTVWMLVACCPVFAFAGAEAEYCMDFLDCYDITVGCSGFAAQSYRSGMYQIYNTELEPVSEEEYTDCSAISDARSDGVDLYRVVKEDGINVFGIVDGHAQVVVPLEYLKVQYLSPCWQYGIYVEKADPSSADYKTTDGAAYAVDHYDFYYKGKKVLTLGREDFDGVNGYAQAYGDYILLRDLERTIFAYDKTGARSYDGPIEYMNEYVYEYSSKTYVHIPTGQSAFTKGCKLTPEEVKRDLMPDNGLYYDLQGNVYPLENFYSNCYDFVNDYARVKRQDKGGLIERGGKEVIPCEFDTSLSYDWPEQMEKFGFVVASVNGKVCFVNSRGEISYQSPYDESVVKGYSGIFRYVQDLTGEYILLTPEGGALERRFSSEPELYRGAGVCAVIEADGTASLIDTAGNTVLNVPTERGYLYAYMTGSGELFFHNTGSRRYSVYRITTTQSETAPAAQRDSGWNCPNCGKENTGKFCTECGTAKPREESPYWTCPSCGQENEGNFCPNCGTAKPA